MSDGIKRISANRVVMTSFVVDVLDIGLSLLVTVLSGSVVMLTQTLQGVADLTASGLLLVGVAESQKEADSAHPFGYGRALYFWTLLSAFISLIVTSGLSIYLGWQRFTAPEPISDLWLTYLVLGLSAITNGYSASLSAKRLAGKESMSKIGWMFLRSHLVETKATLILDLMGTSASILGLVALGIYGLTGDLRFDGLGAMVIGVVLGGLIIILLSALRRLIVGHGASKELNDAISTAVVSFPEVDKVTEIRTMHLSAERLLVILGVHLDHDLTTVEIEKLIAAIKERIVEKVPFATDVQIELRTHR